jgi:hypothetical protein
VSAVVKALLHAVGRAFGVLVALLLLFEEWGWEPLQRLMARIGRLPVLRQIEALIARLPPWAALVALALPSLLLVPAKLGALWLIASGQKMLGVLAIIFAKLIGTALVARLFALTRPALMQVAWFAALYGRWVLWKDALLASVRASWAWRVGRVMRRAALRQWAAWRSR